MAGSNQAAESAEVAYGVLETEFREVRAPARETRLPPSPDRGGYGRIDTGYSALQRLTNLASLEEHERSCLLEMMARSDVRGPRSELIRENAPASEPEFLLAGWACRARTLADGRRQIVEFCLPGDVLGFGMNPSGRVVVPYFALTQVVTAPAARFSEMATTPNGNYPGFADLGRAIARMAEFQLITQIMRTGRQTAYERLANLLLEFHARLHSAGLAAHFSFRMPLTQEMLADGLGLSIVHVNRTLQQLRRERLVELADGVVTLLQPEILAKLADFRMGPSQA